MTPATPRALPERVPATGELMHVRSRVRDRALALSVTSHFRTLIELGLLSPLPAA